MFSHKANFRDFIIFIAGAEFFHTISHIFIGLYIELPLQTNLIEITSSLNTWMILFNASITIILISCAVKLSKKPH